MRSPDPRTLIEHFSRYILACNTLEKTKKHGSKK